MILEWLAGAVLAIAAPTDADPRSPHEHFSDYMQAARAHHACLQAAAARLDDATSVPAFIAQRVIFDCQGTFIKVAEELTAAQGGRLNNNLERLNQGRLEEATTYVSDYRKSHSAADGKQ